MAPNTRDLGYGYAGLHYTVYEAIRFLNYLQPVDLSEIDVSDRTCAICNGCLSDPRADQTYHQFVRLPCGHCFGKSCLTSWLNPLDNETSEDADEGAAERFLHRVYDDVISERVNSQVTNQESSASEGLRSAEWTHINARESSSTNVSPPARLPTAQSSSNPEDPQIPASDAPCGRAGESDTDGDACMAEVNGSISETDQRTPTYTEPEEGHTRNEPLAVRRSLGINELVDERFTQIEYPSAVYRRRPPYEPSDLGAEFSGLVIAPLDPGHNTCPLCRAELFAKPVHGESIRFLRMNIRLWDCAYEAFEMAPIFIEKLYRHECVNFIRNWERDQRAMGEKEREYSNIERRFVLIHTANTFIAVHDVPVIYYDQVQDWSPEIRHELWDIGQKVRHMVDDMPFDFADEIEQHKW